MGMFSQLAQGVDWSSLGAMALRVVVVLLCLVVHEVCHGLAAYWLGDPTAKRNHRLSLNPLRHLDPFGLLMMVVVGFGWAKPVPVDPRYFKNPKGGMAITALAGPLSNLLMAYLSALALGALSAVAAVRGDGGPHPLAGLFCPDGEPEHRPGHLQPHPLPAAGRVQGGGHVPPRPVVLPVDAAGAVRHGYPDGRPVVRGV